MPWFKVDDGFHRSKKVRRLSKDKVMAVGVWTLAGDWSADNLTDGFVPWEIIDEWDPKRRLSQRLFDVGLWDVAEHDGEAGIQFHDWADYQPTAEQVKAERAAAAERQRKARDSRRASRGSHAVTPIATDGVTESVTHNGSNGVSSDAPTRPDPTKRKDSLTAARRARVDQAFDDFWAAYPRKVGKDAARKAWTKAALATSTVQIIEGAKNYAGQREGEDSQFTAHPATWLNAGRWDDEPPRTAPAEDFQLPPAPRDIADDPDPAVFVRWARAQRDAWVAAHAGRSA